MQSTIFPRAICQLHDPALFTVQASGKAFIPADFQPPTLVETVDFIVVIRPGAYGS